MSVANKTIQEKREELQALVAWFSSDDFVLEAALDTFKQAEKLAVAIEKDLTAMQNEIRIVKEKFDAETA